MFIIDGGCFIVLCSFLVFLDIFTKFNFEVRTQIKRERVCAKVQLGFRVSPCVLALSKEKLLSTTESEKVRTDGKKRRSFGKKCIKAFFAIWD